MSSIAKIVRAKGTMWQARWFDPEGRLRKQSFPRKIDAERHLITLDADKLRGSYIDPAAGRVSLEDYAEQWRASQPHRATTAKAVEQHLRCYILPALGSRPLSSIRPSEVQAWATGLSKKIAPSTTRTVTNTLKSVFKAAGRDRLITHNPCDGLVLPRVPPRRVVPLTVEQVDLLIAGTPEQYRALTILGVGTGLRAGELFGLQVRHINFLRRTLSVEQQVQQMAGHGVYTCEPKTPSSYRTVPLPQVVVDALAEHLALHPAGPDGWLFSAPEGGPIVRTSFVHSAWGPACRAAGLRGVGMHAMRHFYASALIRGGLSVKVVSERLGHANAAMTLNVYAHLWPDDEDRTRAALDELLGNSRSPSIPQTGSPGA